MKVGDVIKLVTPDNPYLDGAVATIMELTEWGAHVATPQAATGKFRALFEEMEFFAGLNGYTPKDKGYTGDVCQECGGVNVRKAGACSVCDDCGTTSGCG